MDVSPTTEADLPALHKLYQAAFAQEDLVPLVLALLAHQPAPLSLCTRADRSVTGHVIFTPGTVSGSGHPVALLGPLGVAPEHQRKGIGSLLVRSGLRGLVAQSITTVLVLGDPGYYARFGFKPQTRILAPYDLPDEWAGAFQLLADPAHPPPAGTLVLPQPWMSPALWAP